ncbi:MAG: methylmalonyl-CoA mutase family protein, partial [Hyphomicrobiaceae bacterium]
IAPLHTRADGPVTAVPSLRPRGPGWRICQIHAGPDPKTANAAVADDVQNGVGGLVLHIEAPGRYGLPMRSTTLAEALDGVDPGRISVALMAGDNALDAAGVLTALWRARGTPADTCHGAFNFDPLGTLARTGALTWPIERAVGLAATFAADPQWAGLPVTALLADGCPYHEAGGSDGQELAAMLATLVAYLRACDGLGLAPPRALARIAVALAADADLFSVVAKLRAARWLIRRVADACGAGVQAGDVPLTVVTSERMMARHDPWTNILRTTVACAGAAFGGADAIAVRPFTHALGQPDAFARRVARNIQIVLQDEAALGRVLDPAAGSWYVDRLTDALAHKAWTLFQDIEAGGGMAAALKSGSVQDRIAAVAQERDRRIAAGKDPLTGVSAFPYLDDKGIATAPHPPVPPVADAARQIRALTPRRLAEPFETLRDAAEAHRIRTGKRPSVFLASLGPLADHGARSTWAQNFFAAGGLEAPTSAGYETAAEAAAAFRTSQTAAACICAADTAAAALVEETVRALRAEGAKLLLLAGRPENRGALAIDMFVFAGSDALAALAAAHRLLGVRG